MTISKFRADLLYGASKTRKTTNCGLAAEYYLYKTGKRARYVTADGGGYEPIEPLVVEGFIDVWPLNEWEHPIEAMDFACQGWWPKDTSDRKSPLVPPTAETWTKIGFYGFEGLTSFGDLVLGHLRKSQARLSQDPAYVWKDGATSYAGSNMSYYGFVQDRLYDFVMKTQMLPVERVLWTALEGKGDEEGTKTPVYGPAIAGKKSIGKAPQWFGNCLHLELLTADTEITVAVGDGKDAKGVKQVQQNSKVVMYLQPHADPLTRIPFPAGTRAPYKFAAELPPYMAPDLGQLYARLDELKEKAAAQLRAAAAK